ncbi:protein fluG [Penicillium macrosclerotiorum]|uniref:protein fluG n=1 Tax=Penicillium macrosclerotiorum TaxID=303699 RepID=UPI002547A1E4|nr:protein fluG [Penicillium macrosclerotiorum]KAJ5692008.1 protein fluG [Penicillium macrosclerotiorum]
MGSILEPPISILEQFLLDNSGVDFVWVHFMPYTANTLVRMLPISTFVHLIKENGLLSFPKVAFFVAPGDRIAEGGSLCGNFYLRPDLTSIYLQPGSNGTRATIRTYSVKKDGNPIPECPKAKLKDLYAILQQELYELDVTALVGFEIEVVFLKHSCCNGRSEYKILNNEHAFSEVTAENYEFLDLIESISRELTALGVPLQQFHAESAPGQWEFVLPPFSPLESVTVLLKARDTIMAVARSFGYRATLHPRLMPGQSGTGCHTHISINSTQNDSKKRIESFFAGIIYHLPSVLAFTLPQEVSYERVKPGIWSGGEYAAWGWENRETPLRRIGLTHFEVKLVDGLANPYLALCALFAAGIDGIRSGLPLTGGNCPKAPEELSVDERHQLGVEVRLPKTLQDSLDALEKNTRLYELMGAPIISTYTTVKRGEMKELREMSTEARQNYLISRY